MMKKLLSIIMSVCMLFTMIAIPAVAEEATQTAELTHSYYSWDFSEENLYTDYENPVKPDGVTYDFKAVSTAGNKSFAYAELNGKDALRIRYSKSSNNIMFTPLKADGTPFVLEAGKEYVVTFEAYIKRFGGAWARPHYEIYTVADGSAPRTHVTKTVDEVTTDLVHETSENKVMNPYSALYGTYEYNYWGSAHNISNATYYDAYSMKNVDGVNTFTLLTDSEGNNSNNGDIAVAADGKETLLSYTKTVSLVDDATLESEWGVVKNDDGSYTYNDKVYTNFLGFSLPGAYNSYWIEGYDENAFENAQDADGNWYHRSYAEYYVTNVTVSEVGVGSVNYHVGDQVTTVVGEPGDAVDLTAPAAPEGKYFVNWYTDAEFTTPITGAQTIAEGAPLELYAKFNEYGSYVKLDFESGSHPATAVQYTAEGGFYYPLRGYSYKEKYANVTADTSRTPVWTKDDLINDLTRNNVSTDYPESAISFYSDRTWGMPGGVFLHNPDGSLFIPEAGEQYKITYKYRAPLHNGNNIGINVVYGIPDALMNTGTSADKTCFSKELDWNSVTEVVSEWTTETVTVTIPEDDSTSVPALGLNIGGAKKVAIDTDGDEVTDAYAFTVVDLDYIEVEKIPTATVTYKDNAGNTTSTKTYEVGATIEYADLTANFNYDYVWSLSNTEYKAVPKTVEKDEDITVYAYQNPVLSFENYPVCTDNTSANTLYNAALPYDNELNTQVTTEDAYTGTHSMKLRDVYVQYLAEEPSDWATAWTSYYEYDEESGKWVKLTSAEAPVFEANKYGKWRNAVESGMTVIEKFDKVDSISLSYKISFKYKATENNKGESTFTARLFPYANIWWGAQTITGTFTFPAGATDGWQTGEMYVTVSDFTNVDGKTFMTSGYYFVLDLKWDGKGTQYAKEIYVDDITITENYVNTPTLYVHDGETVTTITEGLTAGGEVDLSTLTYNTPANKYFMGWKDALGNDVTSVTIPAATKLSVAHVYADYGTYPDGVTIDTTGATQPTLKGYSAFTSSTLAEAGWARKTYTDEGVKFEKALGGANRFNPTKTDGFNQTSSLDHYVAVAQDLEEGTQINAGWGACANYVLRDKDGNAVMAKPNTKYAISVTYEKIAEGSQTLAVGIGRKVDYLTTNTNAYGYNTYNRFYSSNFGFANLELTGENDTQTYYVTTGEFTEGDVPVISLHYNADKFIVERVAEAEGVASYVVNDTTYYPYKIVSAPGVLIKDVQIIEIDEGNTVVTYKYYEESVGFSAVLKDNVPGTALDVDTKNADEKWYGSVKAYGNEIKTVYPSANAVYYNAAHMQIVAPENRFGDNKHNGGTEEVITYESTAVDVNGTTDYALHVSASDLVKSSDQETMIIATGIKHGHTYKVSYKYKATAIGSKFGFLFSAGQSDNWWSRTGNADFVTSYVANNTTGEWIENSAYFTVDLLGTQPEDATETGTDYELSRDYRNTLFMTYVQDAGETANDLYFLDFEVIDLGEVVATGGASILTAEAAEAAGQQAMRYYFDYATTDGSDITLDGTTLKVVERGFLYRNGYLAAGATEAKLFRADNSAILKRSKSEDLNTCWAYTDGVMRFSTYVTGFDIGDTEKKLEVKAYLLVEDANGVQFYIYSDTINRTVAGVQDLGDATDGDINAGL